MITANELWDWLFGHACFYDELIPARPGYLVFRFETNRICEIPESSIPDDFRPLLANRTKTNRSMI